jgi:extradiol dioxygenase family protein
MTHHVPFHLSIGVHSLEESAKFFTDVLGGSVTHEDASGYINVEVFGSQITLKKNSDARPDQLADLHFGFNLSWGEFEQLSKRIVDSEYQGVVMKPKVADGGTSMERIKMYLKCPTGYLVELKGYK